MEREKRPSVYLEEKCDALLRVMDFFAVAPTAFGQTMVERMVVFLSQIDFWDWELDNVIYSFVTFADRAKAWEYQTGSGLADALHSRGILVRVGAVKDLKHKRQARSGKAPRVVAPTRRLNEVIVRWNHLLEACEDRVLVPPEERRRAVEFGAQVLPDLSRYRKPLQDVSEP